MVGTYYWARRESQARLGSRLQKLDGLLRPAGVIAGAYGRRPPRCSRTWASWAGLRQASFHVPWARGQVIVASGRGILLPSVNLGPKQSGTDKVRAGPLGMYADAV